MEIAFKPSDSATSESKLYGEMCHKLARLVDMMVEIFPGLEAVQPRESGMQALCGLHWALDKAKSLIQHCADSSKLYLAITGESILVRFERVRNSLDRSLRRLEQLAPQDLAQQVAVIIRELEQLTFMLDPSDQEAGNEIIALFQKEKQVYDLNASSELDLLDRVAFNLGIISGKAVVAEKKALKRLLNKAHNVGDKKKELIAAYLLHLLRRHTKVQKLENLEEGSVLHGSVAGESGSYPSSPSKRISEVSTSERDSEDHSSDIFEPYAKQIGISSKETSSCLGHVPLPPEEFRCPISLQLMSEPFIVSSGQTYERVCIEKWFEEGHDTCPKTKQKLAHLNITPNYCVKGLIASWCERHGVPIPNPPSPPPSLVTDWRWGLFSDSGSMQGSADYLKGGASVKKDAVCTSDETNGEFSVLCIEECSSESPIESASDRGGDSCSSFKEREAESGPIDSMESLENLISGLKSPSLEVQCRVAEEIRLQTKDNAEARFFIGNSGSISGLVEFLRRAIDSGNLQAQETAALALLNVAVNNNRNKAEIVSTGAVPLLLKLFNCEIPLPTQEAAVVVLLTLSCLDENKPSIGSSGAISFLVDLLETGSDQGVKDALTTLVNLSIFTGNSLFLIRAGTVPKLVHLLSLGDADLTEKCIALLYNLASIEEGRFAIAETESCIASIAEVLDNGSTKEREHAVATFLLLCANSSQHSQFVLREGVIPSLVMLSANGSPRGKDKAQKLLQHFREQRQKDCIWHSSVQATNATEPSNSGSSLRRLVKTIGLGSSLRKGRISPSFGFFRRSKSLSFYRC